MCLRTRSRSLNALEFENHPQMASPLWGCAVLDGVSSQIFAVRSTSQRNVTLLECVNLELDTQQHTRSDPLVMLAIAKMHRDSGLALRLYLARLEDGLLVSATPPSAMTADIH